MSATRFTNRWVMAAWLLACLTCLGLVVAAFLPSGPGVTPANFHRLKLGMTLAAAEALLGGPAHDTSPNGTNWSNLMAA